MDYIKGIYHWAVEIFAAMMVWIVTVVGKFGYVGIIIMMAMESSLVPLPSELVIPPAGYLTVQGDMNIVLVIICGTFGSLIGASFNYYLGMHFGRAVLLRYGKYILLPERRLNAMDYYFQCHGEITTFIGRLIPVVRHLISIPAGISRMHFGRFLLYTGIGAFIWVTILAFLGRLVGNNIELVKEHLHTVLLVLIPVMIVIVIVYIYAKRRIEGVRER